MHTRRHVYINILINTYKHTNKHAYIHTYMHTHTHIYARAHIYIHIKTHRIPVSAAAAYILHKYNKKKTIFPQLIPLNAETHMEIASTLRPTT